MNQNLEYNLSMFTSLQKYINQVVIQPKIRCHSRKNTPYLPISKSFSLGSNTVHELLNWCPTLSNLTKSHWIGFQPQNKSYKKTWQLSHCMFPKWTCKTGFLVLNSLKGFFLRLVFEFERNLQFQFRPVLYQYVYVFFFGCVWNFAQMRDKNFHCCKIPLFFPPYLTTFWKDFVILYFGAIFGHSLTI
jgi:hypothetical protein